MEANNEGNVGDFLNHFAKQNGIDGNEFLEKLGISLKAKMDALHVDRKLTGDEIDDAVGEVLRGRQGEKK